MRMLREWFWRNSALATPRITCREPEEKVYIKTVCGSCLPAFYMNKLLEKSAFFCFRNSSLAYKLSLSVFRQTSKILYLAGLALGALLCATNSFPFLWSLQVSGWLCVPCIKHVNKPLLFFFFSFFFRVIEIWFFISVPSDIRAISVWVSGSLFCV